MKYLIFIFLTLAMLNLEAIEGIQGGLFFCDGLAQPYSVCLTNKAGDVVCHQFTDSAFTMEYHENWAIITITSAGYQTTVDTLVMNDDCLVNGYYYFGAYGLKRLGQTDFTKDGQDNQD
jgi:hypothetical protein